jgi:hypothetical protein
MSGQESDLLIVYQKLKNTFKNLGQTRVIQKCFSNNKKKSQIT